MDDHTQIVNLSLSGPADPLLRDLIREGLHRGILFIGAAPAEGGNRDGQLLAIDGVIEVADGGIQGDAGTPLHAPGSEILICSRAAAMIFHRAPPCRPHTSQAPSRSS